MAFDRQGTGLVIIRICLGVFFIGQALGKLSWIAHGAILSDQLAVWLRHAVPGSMGHAYLQRVAVPGAAVFARLVPLGEFACGVALLLGFSTPLFAFLAFFMVLNYQIAAGTLVAWSVLGDRTVLPVLGSTLGLALAGGRLPWSIRP